MLSEFLFKEQVESPDIFSSSFLSLITFDSNSLSWKWWSDDDNDDDSFLWWWKPSPSWDTRVMKHVSCTTVKQFSAYPISFFFSTIPNCWIWIPLFQSSPLSTQSLITIIIVITTSRIIIAITFLVASLNDFFLLLLMLLAMASSCASLWAADWILLWRSNSNSSLSSSDGLGWRWRDGRYHYWDIIIIINQSINYFDWYVLQKEAINGDL